VGGPQGGMETRNLGVWSYEKLLGNRETLLSSWVKKNIGFTRKHLQARVKWPGKPETRLGERLDTRKGRQKRKPERALHPADFLSPRQTSR
jgi:hypothetical protein